MGRGGSKTERIDIIDSYDPRVTGRAALKGTLFRYIPTSGTPEVLIKGDDGFSTDWAPVGTQNLPITVAAAASTANVDIGSAPANIDGIALLAGDLVLLKDQTAPAENGVYEFNGTGNAMTRATGWDSADEFIPGRQVYVDEGTANEETLWANADYVATLGTTAVTFINLNMAGMALDFSNALPSAIDLDLGGNNIGNLAERSFYVQHLF